MAQDSQSRKLDQYIVRFPEGMRDQLKQAATSNNRSLNAEIVARLAASFTRERQRSKLTDEEREDLWQWLQEKAKADQSRPVKKR